MDKTIDLLHALLVHRAPAVASMDPAVVRDIAAEAAKLSAEVAPYRAAMPVAQSPFDFAAALKRAEVA